MKNINRYYLLSYTTLIIPVFIYVIYRAYSLSFTHDESLSYFIFDGIIPFFSHSNNHALNTLLMWFFEYILGDSEFVLRLPNVLAFLLSCYALWEIIKQLKFHWLGLIGVSVIIFNPFVLEFFALARGYGLAMGFTLWSISHLLKSFQKNTTPEMFQNHLKWGTIAAGLATWSYLGMINLFIATSLLFAFRMSNVYPNWKDALKANKKNLLVNLLFLLPSIWLLIRLGNKNQLYYGAENLEVSMSSVLLSGNYNFVPGIEYINLIQTALYVIFALAIPLLIARQGRKGKFFSISTLIFLIFLALWFEHTVFEAKYPQNRTALYFVALMGVYLMFFFNEVIQKLQYLKYPLMILSALIFLTLGTHLWRSHQFEHTLAWKYDSHTKDVIKIIMQQTSSNSDSLTISNSWLFEPSLNYYIKSRNLPIKFTDRDGIKAHTDYIYAQTGDSIPDHFERIKTFESSSSALYRNKESKNK